MRTIFSSKKRRFVPEQVQKKISFFALVIELYKNYTKKLIIVDSNSTAENIVHIWYFMIVTFVKFILTGSNIIKNLWTAFRQIQVIFTFLSYRIEWYIDMTRKKRFKRL